MRSPNLTSFYFRVHTQKPVHHQHNKHREEEIERIANTFFRPVE
jgi:hypothetical protein